MRDTYSGVVVVQTELLGYCYEGFERFYSLWHGGDGDVVWRSCSQWMACVALSCEHGSRNAGTSGR